MTKITVRPGQTYNRLLVISMYPGRPYGKIRWLCLCKCGNESLVTSQQLTSGHTKSCGCYKTEMIGIRAKIQNKTHGESYTVEYTAWGRMRARCHDVKHQAFKLYGGRGIKICDRWNNYLNFLKDMGRRPSNTHSLDRIDSNGNYEPSNCRWGTKKEQSSNRRNNILITHNSETVTAAEWDRRNNFPEGLVARRLKKGWSADEAISSPRCKRIKRHIIRLTNTQIEEIKSLISLRKSKRQKPTFPEIGAMYGISRECIDKIRTGIPFRHL